MSIFTRRAVTRAARNPDRIPTDTYPFVVLEIPEEREKLLAALTPRDREVIEDVMAQNPGLTAAETIRHARAMGM